MERKCVLLFGRTFWNVRFPAAEKPCGYQGLAEGGRVFSIYCCKAAWDCRLIAGDPDKTPLYVVPDWVWINKERDVVRNLRLRESIGQSALGNGGKR